MTQNSIPPLLNWLDEECFDLERKRAETFAITM